MSVIKTLCPNEPSDCNYIKTTATGPFFPLLARPQRLLSPALSKRLPVFFYYNAVPALVLLKACLRLSLIQRETRDQTCCPDAQATALKCKLHEMCALDYTPRLCNAKGGKKQAPKDSMYRTIKAWGKGNHLLLKNRSASQKKGGEKIFALRQASMCELEWWKKLVNVQTQAWKLWWIVTVFCFACFFPFPFAFTVGRSTTYSGYSVLRVTPSL